jgi:hypothetical protein
MNQPGVPSVFSSRYEQRSFLLTRIFALGCDGDVHVSAFFKFHVLAVFVGQCIFNTRSR